MVTTDIKTFEDLECWKACRALRLFVAKTVVNEAVKLLNGYMNYLKRASKTDNK